MKWANSDLSQIYLRLNTSKTQLMWLGLSHLLDRITCTDISVLIMHVFVSECARDLGAVVGGTRHCHLSSRLQPALPTSTCPFMPPRCLSRHSFHVTWTTATHCCMASVMGYFTTCSQYRMLLRGWSQALISVTTSHHCCSNCTGFQSISESCSRLCTSH